jgi:hypothetical protein
MEQSMSPDSDITSEDTNTGSATSSPDSEYMDLEDDGQNDNLDTEKSS